MRHPGNRSDTRPYPTRLPSKRARLNGKIEFEKNREVNTKESHKVHAGARTP
jgi:hypothetical protein